MSLRLPALLLFVALALGSFAGCQDESPREALARVEASLKKTPPALDANAPEQILAAPFSRLLALNDAPQRIIGQHSSWWRKALAEGEELTPVPKEEEEDDDDEEEEKEIPPEATPGPEVPARESLGGVFHGEGVLMQADGLGNLHVRLDTSEDDGYELLRKDGTRYLRRRFAPFHRYGDIGAHAPRGGEEAWRAILVFSELYGDAIAFKPRDPSEIRGRDARRFAIGLSGRPLPTAPDRAPPRSWEDVAAPTPPPTAERTKAPPAHWRDGLEAVSAEGELHLDEKTGVPLELSFRGELVDNTVEPATVLELHAKLAWSFPEGDDAPKINAPEEAGDPPQRPREPVDRLHFWRKQLNAQAKAKKKAAAAEKAAAESGETAKKKAAPKKAAPKKK